MSEGRMAIDNIEVTVSGLFTTHHEFEIEAGSWGEVTFPAFAQHGTFRSAARRSIPSAAREGQELHMRKVHWLRSEHELTEGETVRGRADRRGLLHSEIDIVFDGQEYCLAPQGILSRAWFLADAQGSTLLEIQPHGVFRQGVTLTIEGPIPPELIVFAYYLVHERQQEEAAGVAAMAGAASS